MKKSTYNISVLLITVVFIVLVLKMLSLILLKSNIAQAINTDFNGEIFNKKYTKYFWQGGDFSIEYNNSQIKVIRDTSFRRDVCSSVHLNINSEIVDILESERSIKEKCSKFEGRNNFIIVTKSLKKNPETKQIVSETDLQT